MKVNQNEPFSAKVIMGSRGILYAIANQKQVEMGDSTTTWEADAIAINAPEEADKAIKQFLIDTIQVTTNTGKVFDGNDVAIINMSAAIQSSSILNITTTAWKLADNTIADITYEELKEALALAIQAKGAIILGDA